MGYLHSLVITFDNGESKVTYSANSPAVTPSPTFDNGFAQVRNSIGDIWLELVYDIKTSIGDNTKYSSIFLHDHYSKTTIGLFQFYMQNVYVNLFYYYSFAVGKRFFLLIYFKFYFQNKKNKSK